jgi:RNA polymerase-binding protein DksA
MDSAPNPPSVVGQDRRRFVPVSKPGAEKTAAKKESASQGSRHRDLVVAEGEKSWSKAELAEVTAELTEQRARLIEQLAGHEQELDGLMRDSGDGAGQDQADIGASSFERDQELVLLNNERGMLAQVDRALARIQDGSYGVCESCGNPIGKLRVMAFPRATLCLPCKQREERH